MNGQNKKNYGKTIKIILIALIVVVAAVIGIRIIMNNTHTENDERPIVKAENPQVRDLAVYTKQIGKVEPAESVNVLALMAGEILEVNFNAGDEVKEGDVLLVINSDSLKSLEIALESSSIQLEQAQTNLERTKALYATGAVSESNMEQVQAAADGAQLAYDNSKAQYENTKKYSTITAPISGTVEYKNAEVHDFASQGTPVAVISRKGKNAVTFGVSDDSLESISVGDKIYVSKGNYASDGIITEINGMIGQNGLYNVKADLTEEGGITTNSRVVVEVMKQRADGALTIPINSIYHSGDESFTYVLTDDNKAEKRTIVTGVYDDEYIQVLEGIDPSENVIYTWSKELFNGAEVVVNNQ